jgi:hypothetical protein
MNAYRELDLASACDASLERSRHRRAVARRLRTRRRRNRGGSGAVAGLLSVAALVAPFAIAQGTGSSGKSPTASTAVLNKGSRGAVVARVQRALGVSPTGYFGSRTRAAVRSFQRAHGLIVDGIAGPQTLAALGISAAPAPVAKTAAAGPPSGTLARIAQCESGSNPTAVSRTGIYRGKYQFSRATWRAMGGSGDPAAAPEAEQDRLAAKLYAQQGSAPWPNCA